MSAGVSSVGGGRPAVISGASKAVAAPPAAKSGASSPAAAPKMDFSSNIQALLKTLEQSPAGEGKVNTYG